MAGPLLLLLMILVSAGAHVAVWAGLRTAGLLSPRVVPPPERVRIAVVEEKPRPPPPKPTPPPPKPRPQRVYRHFRPRPVKPPPKAPPPPVQAPPAPPPPTVEAKKATPKPIPLVGISFSSTSTAGSFAMNVGNTAMGSFTPVAPAPKEAKPYKAKRYVPVYELPVAPALLGCPSDDEMAKTYPPAARRDGVEDTVIAKLVVDSDGSVARVRVVSWTHKQYPFDVAAEKDLKRCRFRPGKLNGQAVATEITYTLHFELPY